MRDAKKPATETPRPALRDHVSVAGPVTIVLRDGSSVSAPAGAELRIHDACLVSLVASSVTETVQVVGDPESDRLRRENDGLVLTVRRLAGELQEQIRQKRDARRLADEAFRDRDGWMAQAKAFGAQAPE